MNLINGFRLHKTLKSKLKLILGYFYAKSVIIFSNNLNIIGKPKFIQNYVIYS